MTTENNTLSDREIRRIAAQLYQLERDPQFLHEQEERSRRAADIAWEKSLRDTEKQMAKLKPKERQALQRDAKCILYCMIFAFLVTIFTIISVPFICSVLAIGIHNGAIR